jgi:hypothetical protein
MELKIWGYFLIPGNISLLLSESYFLGWGLPSGPWYDENHHSPEELEAMLLATG